MAPALAAVAAAAPFLPPPSGAAGSCPCSTFRDSSRPKPPDDASALAAAAAAMAPRVARRGRDVDAGSSIHDEIDRAAVVGVTSAVCAFVCVDSIRLCCGWVGEFGRMGWIGSVRHVIYHLIISAAVRRIVC